MEADVIAGCSRRRRQAAPPSTSNPATACYSANGTEVRLDGEELTIMKESDIMGIVEGGGAAAKTS
jgi:co-chaperonin GroES (HSP10)